jgi:hypothetical protein
MFYLDVEDAISFPDIPSIRKVAQIKLVRICFWDVKKRDNSNGKPLMMAAGWQRRQNVPIHLLSPVQLQCRTKTPSIF